MEQKYFKAKIPFSSGNGVYNPADKEPSKANADMVDSWIKAGYCEEAEAPIEIPAGDPKIEVINEPPSEPNEEPEQVEDTNTPDEVETPENEENEKPHDDFETMSYPNLVKLAKSKGIESKKKDEILKALRGE
jgi:hypothetical protein